jgi:hypothetical protein
MRNCSPSPCCARYELTNTCSAVQEHRSSHLNRYWPKCGWAGVLFLNRTYRRPEASRLVEQDPMIDVVLRKQEEEAEAQRKNQIVEAFKSIATPVQGAVNYDQLK